MKKRLLALGMAAAMAFTLAACGGSSSGGGGSEAPADSKAAEESKAAADEKAPADEGGAAEAGAAADITLWTYPVGKWGDSATVDELLSNFNAKYPDIHVTVEYLDYTNGDDQVNTAIEGGQAPDLVLEGPERLVANWGARGLMVDLSDLFAKDEAKDIYENVEAACKSTDGKYYEYPLCMVAHCMAVNKTIFEQADALQYMDLDTHSWTTDNFLKAVQAVYDSGHENVGAVYCAGQGGDQGTRALINNLYSGTFTNADHTAYTANSPENIKALEALVAQDGIGFDASLVGGDEINLFRQNVLAVSFCWNAQQQNNADNGEAGHTNSGDEIIPMLFPSDDGKTELCGGIWGFGIFDNGDAAKIEAAKTFIDFMANDPDQVRASVLASGFFPAHKDVTDVYDGSDTADVMAMFTEYFMPSMGDYYQVVPGWAEARTEWWNMLQRIGSGGDVAEEVGVFDTNANAAASK